MVLKEVEASRTESTGFQETGEDWTATMRLAEAGFKTGDRTILIVVRDRFARIFNSTWIANELMISKALNLYIEKHRPR